MPKGIPVHYYISPQVWAWKKGRVHTIKHVVDRMYVILPFEKEWYAKYGMEVEFVGHPLLDAIEQEGRTELEPFPGDDGRPVVALLPGSRRQEITRMLPLMVGCGGSFPRIPFRGSGRSFGPGRGLFAKASEPHRTLWCIAAPMTFCAMHTRLW